MTLRTPLRSDAPHTEEAASWSNAYAEAEWVDAPTPTPTPNSPRGRGASLPALPPAPAPALSPGLARLLNAALIDSTFAALFLASPMDAARRAIETSGGVFGTTLPDPALRLTLPALNEGEWALLRRLPRTESLAVAAQELRRLASRATIHEVAARAVQPGQSRVLRDMTSPSGSPLSAPASPGGALAGAA